MATRGRTSTVPPPAGKRVTLRVDGKSIQTAEGTPVAVALFAKGRVILGRSVKYHRARGAYCFAKRCDGCLMRVDGVGNTETCAVGATDGMRIETQNVVGTADADVLAAADWFFPNGMNHHEMFTQSRPINAAMQKVARRIAGIGTLPASERPVMSAEEATVDVLVIGAGVAGVTAALAARDGGSSVMLIDERATRSVSTQSASLDGIDVRTAATAVSAFPNGVLIDSERALTRVRATRLIVATGSHEGGVAIAGSDLPAVVTSYGASVLLAHGVQLGTAAVVSAGAPASAITALLHAAGVKVLGPFGAGEVVEIRARRAKRVVVLARRKASEQVSCDLVVVCPPQVADYELGAQAGVETRWTGTAFVLAARATDGATNVAHVRAIGACAGIEDRAAVAAQARAAGRAVAAEIRRASTRTEEAR